MQSVHIIGIGGTFMGSLARLAQEMGFRVTGCDSALYPPMSDQIASLGIDFHEGFDAHQLDFFKADIYIIGNVAKRTMPVVEEILNRKLPYTSGPQWLYENLLHRCRVLAVAGTHGKTTTSSMLAWILEDCGLKPGFLIGGVPQNFEQSSRLSDDSNPIFVIEADEYDTAFFDKRSKFVHYHPDTVILNNLEYDHADIFPDLAAIQTQFHHLLRTIPGNGFVIAPTHDTALAKVINKGCWSQRIYFDDLNHYHIECTDENHFFIMNGSEQQGEIHWNLCGKHNRSNALAAILAAQSVGISIRQACQALSKFDGVKRRMQWRGSQSGIDIYDDFAHHPAAIATTIDGAKKQFTPRRIVTIFEPRSNSMKAGALKSRLAESLRESDLSFCYAAGIEWNIEETLAPLGEKVRIHRDFALLLEDVQNSLLSGDVVLIMSNGGFQNIHEKLLDRLAIQSTESKER